MKDKFLKMKIGEYIEIKKSISTKQIYRISKNEWELNCFVDGWNVYYFNIDELIEFFNN